MSKTPYEKMCYVLPHLIEDLALNLLRNKSLDKEKVLFGIYGIYDQNNIHEDFYENFETLKKEAAIYTRNYFREMVPNFLMPPHQHFDYKYEMDLIFYHLFEKKSTYLEGPFRSLHLNEYDDHDNFDNGNIVLIKIFSNWLNNLINNCGSQLYNETYSSGIDHVKKLERLEEEEQNRMYGGSYLDYDSGFNDSDNEDSIDEEAISWQDLYEYNENH